ncbi:unnamed protein product, partial [Mesorhabditis belari]|uniref:Aromatic-L-amino-acid decarboxylase n=1 Tax=Mesorhabditis belari TaxID=2138241 RepID=A0AAF3EAV6_9BILA
MDPAEFREWGKKMVDFVADMWEGIPDRTPLPDVKPGYIQALVPPQAPNYPEKWQAVFDDLEKVVLSGVTWWHHPNFYAYFPTALSHHAIVADILSGGISAIGFTWKSCPSMTELELAVLDWLVSALGLPDHFRNSHPGPGCGIIQSTASDATLIAFFAARAKAVEEIKNSPTMLQSIQTEVGQKFKDLLGKSPFSGKKGAEQEGQHSSEIYLHPFHDPAVFDRLVAYCSDQAHSSVEKAAMLAGVRLRKLRSERDERYGNFSVTAATLEAAIKEDRAHGLHPFIFLLTMGTTNTCAIDPIRELATICNREKIWAHVDAAYAGGFLLCPEFRGMGDGLELVDSFNYNAHKTMMVNFDCSPLWLKDGKSAVKYFNVDPVYLKHEHQANTADYRHLQVALGRRFRSLKIWFVMRTFGIEKIQQYLRDGCAHAEVFSRLIAASLTFDLVVPRNLGLVCFRIKNASNEVNEELCNAINEDRRIHIVPSKVGEVYFLRLALCSQLTTEKHVRFAFDVISEVAQRTLDKMSLIGS